MYVESPAWTIQDPTLKVSNNRSLIWSCLSPGSTPRGHPLAPEKAHHLWLHPQRMLKAPILWVPLMVFLTSTGAMQECFAQNTPEFVNLV